MVNLWCSKNVASSARPKGQGRALLLANIILITTPQGKCARSSHNIPPQHSPFFQDIKFTAIEETRVLQAVWRHPGGMVL